LRSVGVLRCARAGAVGERVPARSRARAGDGRVGVESKDGEAAVAQDPGQLVLESLGAGAMTSDRRRAASRAARWDRLAMAAVVAGEIPAPAVEDERDIALRAAPHAPAGAA